MIVFALCCAWGTQEAYKERGRMTFSGRDVKMRFFIDELGLS